MHEYSKQYIGDQFLVSGWGPVNERSAMICLIAPDYTACDDVSGCMAVGSGGEVALSTMLMLGQSRDSPLSQTIYRVAAAKFMSEKLCR